MLQAKNYRLTVIFFITIVTSEIVNAPTYEWYPLHLHLMAKIGTQ